MQMHMIGLPAGLMGESEDEQKAELAPDIAARRLLDHFADLQKRHTFKPGDLIQLKQGFELYRWPKYGQPAIVERIFAEPVPGREDVLSERGVDFDIRVMVVDAAHNHVSLFPTCSAWFEPYTGEIG